MSKKPFIAAIDPGAAGAFAWYDADGITHSEYMPDSIEKFCEIISDIIVDAPHTVFYVEQVGTYMPGNSAPAAVKFARHCGVIDGVLSAMGVKFIYVPPKKWMSSIPLTKHGPLPKTLIGNDRKNEIARRKTIRKREIKEHMDKIYPLIRVTLKNADALGILYWAHQNEIKGELPL